MIEKQRRLAVWDVVKGNLATARREAADVRAKARLGLDVLAPHQAAIDAPSRVIPPKANGAFVAAMEDVLEVYHRRHDPDRPLVCLDETSKQLVAETRQPLPMLPCRENAAQRDATLEAPSTSEAFATCASLHPCRAHATGKDCPPLRLVRN